MKPKFLHALLVYILLSFSYHANAQGGTLPLNGSVNGNLAASSTDTWNLTTTSDGLLRLTFHAVNPADLYVTLYDNNGTTVLGSSVESYNNSTVTISTDGLAPGTYVVKITPWSTSSGAYTLADSSFIATPANDVEPNGTRALARAVPLNGNKTGHVGYYYNNQRDTADWYKVTTTADGLLRVYLTATRGSLYSTNAIDVNMWLYDNDGTTQLGFVEVFNGTGSATNTITYDGLQPGTYYIKLQPYSSTEFATYKISDSLFTSSIANDAEPNGTRATALILPVNDKQTGHIGYYYNHQRDSADWYKVTTTADGLLRVYLTATRSSTYSANTIDVSTWLYDNDGTTQLGYAEVYNGTGTATNMITYDGLQPGTYYVKVQAWNITNEFADYTVSDSLFTPSITNDAEPNGTAATAVVLPQNGSKRGHVGYYYNHQRDTADWYKVTTTADGMLRVNLTTARGSVYSSNTLDVNVWLYDIDGTTQLGYVETWNSGNPATGILNVDRLAAGTYYVKVQPYTTSEFADYTISDSLITYNANDKEPDNSAYQAKTIPANETTTGHIGFYFNGGITTDYIDWFKVNYTGTGNLQFTFTLLPHLLGGGIGDVFFQVYKDTAAAPIFNQEFYNTSVHIFSLSSLTQGYYWIKILPFNSNSSYFTAYSILDSFTQVNKAKIISTSYDTAGSCTNNTISYKLSKSHAPYTVQLYRFGVRYGSAEIVNAAKITFDSLPDGIYYATAYGDGATGLAKGKSDTIAVMPEPNNPHTSGIKATQAKLIWSAVTCADYFTIQYRVHNTAIWTSVSTTGNVSSYILSGLQPSTTYDWEVAAIDSQSNMTATSLYTDTVTFTTVSSLIAGSNDGEDNLSVNTGKNTVITIAPNPASSYFIIHYNTAVQQKLTATLYDVNGKAVWTSGAINADALNGKEVMVNQFGSGFYYLKIIDEKGAMLGVAKVSITK